MGWFKMQIKGETIMDMIIKVILGYITISFFVFFIFWIYCKAAKKGDKLNSSLFFSEKNDE